MRNITRARAITIALLATIFAIVTPGQAEAQNAVITGKVTTEFGQAVEGANVFITEMAISVATSAEGSFTITVPAARVTGQQVSLRVRAFGYQPQLRPVRLAGGTQTLNFALKQDVNRLAEVVVTGVTAGTEQRKLGFSVARVDDKEMPVPGANALTQLQGKVPGASIVSASGRPGRPADILMRGPKSIDARGRGQGPLTIVDGVILQSSLADINPADIETIEIVKGAAASSMYGSRAGNGVISITTKSGKQQSDGVKFSARTEYGFGDIENAFPLAQNHFLQMDETKTRYCVVRAGNPTCSALVDFDREALRVNDVASETALGPETFQNDGGIAAAVTKTNLRNLYQTELFPKIFDPVAQMVTNGQRVNSNLDATGRIGGTNFFASGATYWEQGAIKYLAGFRRQSLRLNVDQQVGQDWTFGVRSFYSRGWTDGGNFENANNRGFFGITRTPVGVDLLRTDSQGRLFIRSNPLNQGSQNENPMYWFQNARQTDQNDRYLGNATARYTPLSWLDIDGTLSYDRRNATTFFIRDRGFRTSGNSPNNPLGTTERLGNVDQSYNTALNAVARQTVGGDLRLTYTTRYLYEQQDRFGEDYGGSTLAVVGLNTADNATTGFFISSTEQSIRSIGMMGGVNADFKDRYIADALFRRDGSSLFGSANRWANYGRASLAWRVSEEPWYMFGSAVNDLKLRASTGTAGGRPIFAAQYETFTIGTGGTLTPVTLGNKNLRPETVTETEVGVDAEILSRVGLTVNYASALAKDQILRFTPPGASGFNTQWVNAGTLANKTWEVSANVPIVQRRNLNWSTRISYDKTVSTIKKLALPPFYDGTNQQGAEEIFFMREGEKYGTLYGRKFATQCSDLPANFASQCGGATSQFQRNDEGFLVWTGGKGLDEGITGNFWNAVLPGCVTATGVPIAVNPGANACVRAGGVTGAPWGTTINWGMPIIMRDDDANAQKLPLGNVLPDFRFGVSQTINYKRLFLYGLLDASIGQSVWNEGLHWSYGDFMVHQIDQAGKSTAAAKPLGYFWRAPLPDNAAGLGGFYDLLSPNSNSVEKASYAKIREVNLSYNIGPVRGNGDWTVSVVGRNVFTFTDYRGFDPEVGLTSGLANNVTGSSQLAAVDAFQFPNLRTFNFALSTRF